MIDREIFKRLFTAFGNRIGKDLDPDTAAMYYATLSAELTTEEFQTGMACVFRDHGYATWPIPKQIIEAAKVPTFDAGLDFAKLEGVLRLRVPNKPIVPQLAAHCDPRTVRAFEALGGIVRYDRLTRFNEDDYRSRFLDRVAEYVRQEAIEARSPRLAPPSRTDPAALPAGAQEPPSADEQVTREQVDTFGKSWRAVVGPPMAAKVPI